MDRSIEEKFVKNFVIKDKRERILYELNSLKKRREGIRRICFCVYDNKYIVFQDSKLSDEELFAEVKKFIDVNKVCYVIADSSDDGKFMPFKEAFANMCDFEMSYIIICNENVVLMGAEYEVPCPPCRFILRKD